VTDPAGTVPDPTDFDVPPPPNAEDDEKPRGSFLRELPFLILIALTLAVLVKTFLFQAFFIPSGSMEDTLEINDRVLVNKLSYRIGDVQRGQVVVFDPEDGGDDESIIGKIVRNVAESIGLVTPESDLIKRVIALGGDTVQIRDNTVFVNGEPIDEPYLRDGSFMRDFGPVNVPEGHVFVMGDNRNFSSDSREIGSIPEDRIVGRAFTIIWPPSRWSGL
jgi:signal peptidase I